MRRMTARPANTHQARLLQLLRDGGPNSRAQLGDQVDLSRSKLAVEVDRLLETGLVVADGLAASRGGRRSHNVRLNPELRFLGVDIGATSVDVAVTNAELEILGHINQPLDVREGPVAVFEQVLSMAAKLRASGLAEGFDGAGIGVPGPVRFPEGVPVAPPIMPGWDGFPVREALSQELGCPVMVDNDVNLMALGEQHATALDLIREGGRSTGQVIAGLVSFFNPGLVVIGGGVTGLGHNLLAAIRTQVYRQSLPLATGNLPIVLGELGPTAGVIGAARLISDHLFSPA